MNSQTTCQLRPRFEGSNINTWLGFKHINYLVEEAVLDHFRAHGRAVNSLFEEDGLCLEMVDLDTRIRMSFHTDDVVSATVTPKAGDGDAFEVVLAVVRDGTSRNGARSQVRMRLRPDAEEPLSAARVSPNGLSRKAVLADLTKGINGFAWCRRIPYFYCHYNERLLMSGYLRQMEEVVDLFLADRGISIKGLLDDRRWIPVVTHSSISILGDVAMEEDLYTVFTVENVFKNLTYTGRMDTYIVRNEQLLHTATGRITHGYAEIQSRRAIKLVEFDGRMLAALAGG